MNGWNEILNCALIGTDKKQVNLSLLPDVIVQKLNQKTDDMSTIALRSAALLSFYNNTGILPKQLKKTDFEVIKETKIVAGNELMLIFQEIELSGYYEKENLFNLWLTCLIHREEIVQSKHLLQVINIGLKLKKETQVKMNQVLGETGKRILSLKSNSRSVSDPISNIWLEGKPADRRLFFSELRKSESYEAFHLLQKDWSVESIVFKKSLLEIMATPSNDERNFLKDLYENEFLYKVKEKKTETECRYILSKILLQNGNEILTETTKLSLQKYVVSDKKGLFSKLLGKKLQLNLPEKDDNFLNAAYLQSVYGISTNNSNSALFSSDIAFYFSELVAIVPIEMWSELFSCSVHEVCRFFLEDKQFETTIYAEPTSVLINVLHENAKFSKNSEFIKALLASQIPSSFYDLLEFLNTEEFELYVIKNDLFTTFNAINKYAVHLGEWSQEFSNLILEKNYSFQVSQNQYPNEQIIQIMSKHLTLSSVDKLNQLFLKMNDTPSGQQWVNMVYTPLKRALTIKSSLKALIKI